MSDDFFVDDDDPQALEREQRRREREQRRAKRKQKRGGKEAASEPAAAAAAPVAPPPATAASPPAARPSTAETPKGPKPPRRPASNRRRLGIAGALAAVLLGIVVIAALAYKHFHHSDPPPPVVVRTITVTVPEGYSRAQTAELAKQEGLRGSYEQASVSSKYLNPAKYGGKNAEDLEGFLFPDTFELVKHASAADLVQLQLEDFKRRIAGVKMSYAHLKNLTVYDVLTIASMIEDEAGLESQRKLVAAVIYNRLHEGMPLGIDATTRFATDNYTEPLTESELAVDSPYNTRTNTGLPPGPINSPGLASIEAAAHPAKVDYLFYVAEPGACNKLAFSTTEAEFNADVERYNSAREAAGGNSPDSCEE